MSTAGVNPESTRRGLLRLVRCVPDEYLGVVAIAPEIADA